MNTERMRGFTLVELIVAIGLFAVVMTIAAGAYLLMLNQNRQAESVATGINNLSFALESMSRNIRTGSDYDCGSGDCPSGLASFSFSNVNGDTVTYRLFGSTIQVKTGSGSYVDLTDSTVEIASLMFYVVGTDKPPRDYVQPHVTMVVYGTVPFGKGGQREAFAVETSATMRGSDL